ncbi:MAG: hypothetical protein WCC36_10495 [Gammaproteobacteria bacterium]
MKHTLIYQARREALVLAAGMAVAALGIGAAQAQGFASATIKLQNGGETAGGLSCSFRETGLSPYSVVRYDCQSQYVGVLQQCMFKNQPVGDPQLLKFQNIHSEELEEEEVKNNGSVRATIVTNIPESEENAIICTEPSELTVTAIRWCNNSLLDVTNNVMGPTQSELFAQLENKGTGSVPSCEELANGPFTPPGF